MYSNHFTALDVYVNISNSSTLNQGHCCRRGWPDLRPNITVGRQQNTVASYICM